MRATATALIIALGLVACGDQAAGGNTSPNPQIATSSHDATNATLAQLAALPIKGRAAKTGYTRDQFGAAWADVDHNGCDTRNDILNRDLTAKSWEPGTHDCVVVAGNLAEPYTGQTLHFTKADASAVQIDHVVALSDAWQKGAATWPAMTRLAFANDPRNLLAVDGPANQQKSDGDAATWLPANRSFRCTYVGAQVTVKTAYGLWVTQAEHDAMARVLAACPAGATAAATGAATPTTASAASTLGPSSTAGGAVTPTGVYFGSCGAARAAGAAPIHVGDPGYRTGLDGDGDGIACE